MRLLIAQGPGFYGVNIRLIDEATYERILANPRLEWKAEGAIDEGEVDHVWAHDHENDTMLVVTEDIKEGEKFSVGFDSGWWKEGEKALDEALKEER